MNTKKLLALALGGVMLVGCLAGCSTAAASQGGTSQPGTASPSMTEESEQTIVAVAEGNGSPAEISYEELFKPYAQFGLTYDASKNELTYNGKAVRWFEDYYTVENGIQAGNDFFNENGVVDVYAVRDFTSIVRAEDGSFDPSGKLTGVKEFSAEEFAARDIEAIKNPPPVVALTGDPPSAKELEDMAKEYETFGVTYDIKNDQWYFNGEKVRFFRDVLTSNGEGLTSGKYKGSMRVLGSADGTVDIYTVRDFAHPDTFGNGTLTGIEKYSQAEFDEHTRQNTQSNSGFCTVE
ncbi:hypothetical protein D7V94_16750 [Parablautia intestinalis]|uniref:Uncharacterized protein n=1 Tax=Parablautia intestinalis TaxID=2320100 RepID=A0A3A9ADZ3_9FIRM|nr:hypothetical protein [Parablautia intestinalis]RKI89822.1 hypothetical protein D7V94_16750 [Parablautia intestinalis]